MVTDNEQELILIAKNLKYMLYGFSFACGFILLLAGFIFKIFLDKFKKLDSLNALMEWIVLRMTGIESFASGLLKIDGRLTILEKMCDRRHRDEDVKVDRRKKRN